MMTNYEKIKSMSVEEMTALMNAISANCYCAGMEKMRGNVPMCEYGGCPIKQRYNHCCSVSIKQWLEQEVTEND